MNPKREPRGAANVLPKHCFPGPIKSIQVITSPSTHRPTAWVINYANVDESELITPTSGKESTFLALSACLMVPLLKTRFEEGDVIAVSEAVYRTAFSARQRGTQYPLLRRCGTYTTNGRKGASVRLPLLWLHMEIRESRREIAFYRRGATFSVGDIPFNSSSFFDRNGLPTRIVDKGVISTILQKIDALLVAR